VQEDFQTVLKATAESETTQGNIQDWLELGEGDPRFQIFIFFMVFKYRL
jgi:hypothetical protein